VEESNILTPDADQWETVHSCKKVSLFTLFYRDSQQHYVSANAKPNICQCLPSKTGKGCTGNAAYFLTGNGYIHKVTIGRKNSIEQN